MAPTDPKTPAAAVVIIPPAELWPPIQAIRRRWDRHVDRWMPHLTLLYPFWPWPRFDEAERHLRPVCADSSRFAVRLGAFRFFAHGVEAFTLYLAPAPRLPLVDLQAALGRAIPECDDVTRFPTGFTPHLSVGQARGHRVLRERLLQLEREWRPVEFEVAEIALIRREGDGPFVVDRTIPLGQAAEPGD